MYILLCIRLTSLYYYYFRIINFFLFKSLIKMRVAVHKQNEYRSRIIFLNVFDRNSYLKNVSISRIAAKASYVLGYFVKGTEMQRCVYLFYRCIKFLWPLKIFLFFSLIMLLIIEKRNRNNKLFLSLSADQKSQLKNFYNCHVFIGLWLSWKIYGCTLFLQLFDGVSLIVHLILFFF